MSNNTLEKLNIKRQQIRDNRKLQMRKNAMRSSKKSQLVIPAYHIPVTDKQLREGISWLYNGFLIYLPGLVMLVDPGVDILYRMSLSKINISQINTMFISHGHLDHVAGANVVSDWLIRSLQKTQILAPESVFEEKEISSYHAGFKTHKSGWKNSHFATILEKKAIDLEHGNYRLEPLRLQHGIQCYGFNLYYEGKKISYISDTGYAKKIKTDKGEFSLSEKQQQGQFISIIGKHTYIKKAVAGADLLIVNVETYEYKDNSDTHLTIYDVIDLVKDNGVKTILLSHLNPVSELGEEWGKELSRFVTQNTGIKALYPKTKGLKLNI